MFKRKAIQAVILLGLFTSAPIALIQPNASAARWHRGTPKALRGNWTGKWQYIRAYHLSMRVYTTVTKKYAFAALPQSMGTIVKHGKWKTNGHGMYIVKGLDVNKSHVRFTYQKVGKNKLRLYINHKNSTANTPFYNLYYKNNSKGARNTARGY